MPNGWYKCTLNFNAGTGATTANYIRLQLANADATINVTGNDVNGTYLWGAQLEAGAFATSYIPTTTTALTRNADVATMTGTNFSDWYNASEGTFEFSSVAASGVSVTQYAFSVSDGTNNNLLAIYRPNTKLLSSAMISGGATQHDSSSAVTQENSTSAGNGIAIKASDSARAFKGNSAQSVASGTLPTVDRLQFGNRTDGLRAWNGHISKFAYYAPRLTNAEVQAFSK